MRMKYLGDSYDIVKQSLLLWLKSLGEWSVHPMFTESVGKAGIMEFEAILGAKVISTDVLTLASDRSAYFSCARSCGNLFLDPDTGLRMHPTRGLRRR